MESRPFCYVCRRARVLCVCAEITPVETRTRVIFLQHSDEAWNQIGTARLAHLSLPGSLLFEGGEFASDPRFEAALTEGKGVREPILLYPTIDAVPLESLAGSGPFDLIVVDGTWAQAKQVVKRTPQLRSIRRVRLDAGEKSRYRIRLQPRAECVSTIEAAVRALAVLEGAPARFQPLLDAFERMVDRHIAAAAACGRNVLTDLKSRRRGRKLPPELAGDLDRIVVVHGDTLWRHDPETGELAGADLIQWTALRLATGEHFDRVVRPPDRAITEREAGYLELPMSDVAAAVDHEGLRAAWSGFARPDDVLVSWGYFASNCLSKLLGRTFASQLELRRWTKHILNRKVRRPEDALIELDVPLPQPLGRGRCGKRLAALRDVLLALRDLSTAASAPR
jgi:DTW domain-containing protein YfiP